MSIEVDYKRSELSTDEIKSGLPVASREWGRLVGLNNWLHARGTQQIPTCNVDRVFNASTGLTEYFLFRTYGKAGAVSRVWEFHFDTFGESATAQIITAGVTYPVVLNSRYGRSQPVHIVQHLSGLPSPIVSVRVDILPESNAKEVVLKTISMYEQDRGVLKGQPTDHGVHIQSAYPMAPIIDQSNRSVSGVAEGYKNVDMRRSGFFHFSPGYNRPLIVTNQQQLPLFDLNPPGLAAVRYTGETSMQLTAWVYANMSSAGHVGVVSVNGESGVVNNINNVWIEIPFTHECEDLDHPIGLPGGTWPEFDIRAGVTGGEMRIVAISIIRAREPNTPV